MAKVITFSRTFPSYHHRAGESTYFVEKFLKGRPQWEEESDEVWNPEKSLAEQMSLAIDIWSILISKYHTIRAGERFKSGEYFSPRVWSGRPYNSKQIIIAPDTKIVATYKFEIKKVESDKPVSFFINDRLVPKQTLNIKDRTVIDIAHNDGLALEDFKGWFKYPKPFTGQIIVWNELGKYS